MPTGAAELEPETWQHLPEDLLEIVVQGLPVISKLRWKEVSSRWEAIITSIQARTCTASEVEDAKCLVIHCEAGCIRPREKLPKDIFGVVLNLRFIPWGYNPVKASGPFIVFQRLVPAELIGPALVGGEERRTDVQMLFLIVANVLTRSMHLVCSLLSISFPTVTDFRCYKGDDYFVDVKFSRGTVRRVYRSGATRSFNAENISAGGGEMDLAELGGYRCASLRSEDGGKSVKALSLRDGCTAIWSFSNSQGWRNKKPLRILSFTPSLSASPNSKPSKERRGSGDQRFEEFARVLPRGDQGRGYALCWPDRSRMEMVMHVQG